MTATDSRAGVVETLKVYHWHGTGPDNHVVDMEWKDPNGQQKGARYFCTKAYIYNKSRPAHFAVQIIPGVGMVTVDVSCPNPDGKFEFLATLVLDMDNGGGSYNLPIEYEKIIPFRAGAGWPPKGDCGRLLL